jgi:hypothetical protein
LFGGGVQAKVTRFVGVFAARICSKETLCRSWLANDDGGTFNIEVTVRSPSLASQLLQGGVYSF